MSYEEEHKRWYSMLQRCYNPKSNGYKYYTAAIERWRGGQEPGLSLQGAIRQLIWQGLKAGRG